MDESLFAVTDDPIALDHDACYRALQIRDPRFDGRIFVAVKTTGIYCRPVCPARTPLSRNVTFYNNAAAAQSAGFRPCLRCRPETAPDRGVWKGTSNTVTRALSLIERGVLADGDVEALAYRLGVGGRHLRRLFRQHLGVTPSAVERTRRIHLAKALIHQTDLSMTDIAFASGFQSIRRFNEVFLSLYARPPSSLRRTRRETQPDASGDVTLALRYRPPYDWPDVLEQLRASAISPIEHLSDFAWQRSFFIGGALGAVEVRQGTTNSLAVRIRTANLSVLPEVVARVKARFDLAADPSGIAEAFGDDPTLAEIALRFPGLRVVGAWSALETAIWRTTGSVPVQSIAQPLEAPFARLSHYSTVAMPTGVASDNPASIADALQRACRLGRGEALSCARKVLAPFDEPPIAAAFAADDHALLARCRPWRAYAGRLLLRDRACIRTYDSPQGIAVR